MDSPKILLVDDQPGMVQILAKALSGVGQLFFAMNGAAALSQARRTRPDLILLDAEMPGMSGYDVCQALKAEESLADIPVIFVTGHSGQEHELQSLKLGAADFLSKPVSEPLLLARVQTQLRIKHLNDELRRMALVDALTETTNRRGFDAALTREWLRCQRAGDPISLLMVDVDHFKRFNDSHGHPAGDACLRQVGQALKRAALRPADLVARYGGEEFAVLLPQTACVGARHVAQTMLAAVNALQIPHANSPVASHVTISIGVACMDGSHFRLGDAATDAQAKGAPARNAAILVCAADRALYQAKMAGRARLACSTAMDLSDAGSCAHEHAEPACPGVV